MWFDLILKFKFIFKFYSNSGSEQYYKFAWICDIEYIGLFNDFKLKRILILFQIIYRRGVWVCWNGSRSLAKD